MGGRRSVLSALAICLLGAGLLASCEPEDIVDDNQYYDIEAPSTTFNGVRVFLSSPRHTDSGSRGECLSAPGWEENVNGRAWNWYAANGLYHNDVYSPDADGRNFRSRGYRVAVSRNTRDGDYQDNVYLSDHWGADVHIVSHTNAVAAGCNDGTQYTLTMWKSGDTNDASIAARMATVLHNAIPGGVNSYTTSLYETNNADASYRVYDELLFHTNALAEAWLHGTPGNDNRGASRYSWRYGAVVDNELSYP